jgi:hypothetical protein
MVRLLLAPFVLAAALVFAAPAERTEAVSVLTPLGMATGTANAHADRFAVRYGVALRWLPSAPAPLWSLPYGPFHGSAHHALTWT